MCQLINWQTFFKVEDIQVHIYVTLTLMQIDSFFQTMYTVFSFDVMWILYLAFCAKFVLQRAVKMSY